MPLLVGHLLKIYWKNDFSTESTDKPQILIVPTNNTADFGYGHGGCSLSTSNHDKRDKYASVAGEQRN